MSNLLENPPAPTDPAGPPASEPQPSIAPQATGPLTPDQAVERCMAAYQRAYNASAAKGQHPSQCRTDGAHAYLLAMPSVGSLADVQVLIACVIQGMYREVWVGGQERDLFYAAQVAISAYRCQATKKSETAKK